MKYIYVWLISFAVIYLLYLFFVILRKKKMGKFESNTYYNYLVKVYKLDSKKLSLKKMAHLIALSNSFIIATTFTIILNVENFILMMFSSLLVLIPLQLLIYHILGKTLKRREENV